MRLHPFTLVVRRVNVADFPALIRLGLASRPNANQLGTLPGYAIGIVQPKPALILRPGLQAEYATGKAIGNGVVKVLPLPENSLTAYSDQRQRLAPIGGAHLPKLDCDSGIAVRVARNQPLKSKIVERRVLDRELTGLRWILSQCRRSG